METGRISETRRRQNSCSGFGHKMDVGDERGIGMTLTFGASHHIPASLFLLMFAASLETSTKAQPPVQVQPEQVHFWPRLPLPRILQLTETLSPAGGPGRKLPPEGAADDTAAEERPAGRCLWPRESRGPPGAGGHLCERQGLAAQPSPSEEEQTAGEHGRLALCPRPGLPERASCAF